MRASEASSCYETPFTYPGPMLSGAWLLDGETVLEITPTTGDIADWQIVQGDSTVADTLHRLDADPVYRRYPLLSYGANRNPSNLVWKMRRHGASGPVIGMPVWIENADVVAANLFYSGHFYGDLVWGKSWTEGVAAEAVALLVSVEQAYAIHMSEEVPSNSLDDGDASFIGARLARFDAVRCALTGRAIPSLGYVSWSTVWLGYGRDSPIALSAVAARHRRIASANQQELFERMRARYLPSRPSQALKSDFARHWDEVRVGKRSGYQDGWYLDLVRAINRDCNVGADGKPRTGVSDARADGRLVPLRETWALGPGDRYVAAS